MNSNNPNNSQNVSEGSINQVYDGLEMRRTQMANYHPEEEQEEPLFSESENSDSPSQLIENQTQQQQLQDNNNTENPLNDYPQQEMQNLLQQDQPIQQQIQSQYPQLQQQQQFQEPPLNHQEIELQYPIQELPQLEIEEDSNSNKQNNKNKQEKKKQNNKKEDFQQQNSSNFTDYEKYYKIYNFLPKLKNFRFTSNKDNRQYNNVPQELKSQLENIEDYMSSKIHMWDIEKGQQIYFKLPTTDFQGNQPVIQYQQPTYEVEKLEIGVLTKEQLNSIWRTGSFEVPSIKFSTPYVWQLTQMLIKGRENISKSWKFDISIAFSIIKQWGKYFFNTQNLNQQNVFEEKRLFESIFQPQLLMAFYEIFINFPKRLFDLFIGHRWFQQINQYTVQTHVQKELEVQRNQLAIKDQSFNQFEQQLVGIFRLDINQVKQTILTIEQNFNQKWEKDLLNKAKKQLKEDDPNYDQLLEDSKFQHFIEYLQEQPKFKTQNQKSLVNYVRAYRIIMKNQDIYEKKVAEFELDLNQKIKNRHQIRSQNNEWFFQKREQEKSQNQKKHAKIRDKQILEDLEQNDLLPQYFLYEQQLKLQENQKKLENKIQNDYIKQTRQPQQTFNSYLQYHVGKLEKNNQNNTYRYIYNKNWAQTKSDSFGWRIKHYIVTYFTGCYNIITFLLHYVLIYSPVSLRSIFGCQKYYSTYNIENFKTGKLTPGGQSYTPIVQDFKQLLKDIKTNRQRFEEIPDNAFFGKNSNRICNYISNYVCKLVLYGIFWLFIIYPLICIVLNLLSIVAGLTTIIWMIAALLLAAVFTWLIHDTQQIYHYNKPHYITYWFPILTIILKLVFKGVIQLAMSLIFIFAIMPIGLIFMLLFAISRYTLRSIYDFITFQLIKSSARIPVREDSMAWRIKGPGVEKHVQYYFTLEDEDVFMLVQAELEKIQLDNYKNQLLKIFQEPLKNANKIFGQTLGNYFGATRSDQFAQIRQKQSMLENQLNQKITQRINCFPRVQAQYKIRFNDGELDRLIPITTELVYGFVVNNEMDYIWKQFNVQKEKYKELTDAIWKKVFQNEQILEALSDEEDDYRHEIKKSANDNYAGLQMKKTVQIQNIQDSANKKWKRAEFNRTKRKQCEKLQRVSEIQQQNKMQNNFQQQNLYQQQIRNSNVRGQQRQQYLEDDLQFNQQQIQQQQDYNIQQNTNTSISKINEIEQIIKNSKMAPSSNYYQINLLNHTANSIFINYNSYNTRNDKKL